MRVLLTSAGLETEEIKECFINMAGKAVSFVKALLIPTAAIDADAIIFSNNLDNNLGIERGQNVSGLIMYFEKIKSGIDRTEEIAYY